MLLQLHNRSLFHLLYLQYPLVEWGMTEADCLAYCRERGFDWEGLYDIFTRVSCWCCPLQSYEEMRKLRRHFPEKWKQLLEWDYVLISTSAIVVSVVVSVVVKAFPQKRGLPGEFENSPESP